MLFTALPVKNCGGRAVIPPSIRAVSQQLAKELESHDIPIPNRNLDSHSGAQQWLSRWGPSSPDPTPGDCYHPLKEAGGVSEGGGCGI